MTDPTSQAHTSENTAQVPAPSSDGVVETTSSILPEDGVLAPALQRSGEPGYSPVESADRTFPVKSIVWVDPGTLQTPHSVPRPTPSDGIAPRPLPSPHPRRPLVPTALALALDTRGTVGASFTPSSEESVSAGVTSAATPVELVHHAPSGPSQQTTILEDQGSPGDSAMGDGSSTKRKSSNTMSGGGSHINGASDPPPGADHFPESVMTDRFMHAVTEGGHAVSIGKDAEFVRCEDEPIHTPGAIQCFGALVALNEVEPGRLVVRLASENTEKIIGYTPHQLFQLESIVEILSEEQQDNLLYHIDSVREEDFNLRLSGPEIFNISILGPGGGKRVKLWCAVHINPNRHDLIVCEFEREDDRDHPLFSAPNPSSLEPVSTVGMTYTAEEIAQSTQVISKPLKFPRKGRTGSIEPNAMQMFDLMGQVQVQLEAAADMDSLLKVLVGIVKEITAYHRVMIYRFDSSFNGKVVTELVDTAHTGDLYLGLHFPASDIPSQARELYKVSKMRLLYDRDSETARIVCRTQEDLRTPLDMTHCYLRAMSPIHLKYLENMAVRSSMSLSLKVFGELWGLVSCHTYGQHGTRPPFPLRKLCEHVSNLASRNIERLSYETTLQAQKLINSQLIDKSASEYIIASEDELLKMFEADWGIVSILSETKTFGHISQSQESFAMVEYLRLRRLSGVLASHDVTTDFPDLHYSPGFSVLGGILYVPLSVDGASFMVLFRKAQAQEVKWGGNPHDQKHKHGTPSLLEPRASFKMWREVVTGRSREWTAETVELASLLCAVYGKFIQAWKLREAESRSSRLTQLLLANQAHQVRTPLNAIINYLEIALEGPLDQETRSNLAESHSASKSLVYVINDLLDLTKTEQGLVLTKEEVFDLPACIRSATDSFLEDARRKVLNYEVHIHSALPRYVCGDKSQVRQAISNIIANAFQNTSHGIVQVASYLVDTDDVRMRVATSVWDSGVGMTVEEIDILFDDLEQISNAEPVGDGESILPAGSRLGLGLAVVARVVRNMDGQLRVKSERGRGSCFTIQLPFDIPDEKMMPVESRTLVEPEDAVPDQRPPTLAEMPSYSSGEITLVGRKSNTSLSATVEREGDTKTIVPRQRGAEVCDEENSEERPEDRDSSARSTLTEEGHPPAVLAPDPSSEGLDKKETHVSPAPESGGTTEVVGSGMAVASDEQTPLRVLIAEDDPINFKVLDKRLTKLGHEVRRAMNGEDCAAMYCQEPDSFDIVLMDIQMPIMDGLASTREIRSWEGDGSNVNLSPLARRHGRIPIFAVSASLVEANRPTYIDIGFDGWIPKPINFVSLRAIMMGIADDKSRLACAYAPGRWETGGWF